MPGIFSGLGGAARGIVNFGANLSVNVVGLRKLGALGKRVDKVRTNFIGLGVTTIFLDRLVQSLTRAWTMLNRVLGVVRLAKLGEDMLRLSQFTGVATGRLQAFAAVANTVGAELNDVSDLFQTLTERVDDLRSGTEKGITDDFARFGMSTNTFRGANDGLRQFLVLIREVDKLAPERRMAALEKLLGGDLARKFGQLGTVQDIANAMDEAIRTGQVLSEQQLKSAAKFQRAQRRLGRLLVATSNNLGSLLIPALTEASDLLSELVAKLSGFFASRITAFSDKITRALDPFLRKMRDLMSFIDRQVKPLGETFARLGQALLVISAILGGVLFAKLIGTAIVVSTLAVAFAAMIDDLMTFARGGDSMFGTLIARSAILQRLWLNLKFSFDLAKQGVADLGSAFRSLVQGPSGAMLTFFLKATGVSLVAILISFGAAIGLVGKFISLLVKAFNVLFEIVSLVTQLTTSGLLQVFSQAFGVGGDQAAAASNALGQRLSASGGFLGSIQNAFTGDGPTTTELLLQGGGNRSISVTQNNNITAASSNPSAFASNAVAAGGQGIATMVGSAP